MFDPSVFDRRQQFPDSFYQDKYPVDFAKDATPVAAGLLQRRLTIACLSFDPDSNPCPSACGTWAAPWTRDGTGGRFLQFEEEDDDDARDSRVGNVFKALKTDKGDEEDCDPEHDLGCEEEEDEDDCDPEDGDCEGHGDEAGEEDAEQSADASAVGVPVAGGVSTSVSAPGESKV